MDVKKVLKEVSLARITISNAERRLSKIKDELLVNYEFEKAGDVAPYDFVTLHNEAQELRALIKETPSTISDEAALCAKNLFAAWSGKNTYVAGDRVLYNNQLFKAVADISSNNETWTPDVTSTLWKLVSDPSEEGTIDNPITAEAGLTYEKDKYYSEGDKIYLCIREDAEDGTTLYYLPSHLVGVYFEEVTL